MVGCGKCGVGGSSGRPVRDKDHLDQGGGRGSKGFNQ